MAPFTRAGLRRGARDGLPLAFGILLYGAGFGLIAAQAQMALAEAMAMSAAVFSGSAQLAAMNLMAAGPFTLWSLAATVLLINARYLLFGAAIRPWAWPHCCGNRGRDVPRAARNDSREA